VTVAAVVLTFNSDSSSTRSKPCILEVILFKVLISSTVIPKVSALEVILATVAASSRVKPKLKLSVTIAP
jgi:hypothetical protein